MSDRGQAHALEGVMAAMLVVIAVVLAYQAIVLTPTTAGTVDRDVKSHLGTRAGDVLTAAGDDGSLSRIVRYWNASGNNGTGTFVGADGQAESGYTFLPQSEFRQVLGTLTDNGYAVNIYLESRVRGENSDTARYVLLKQGEPSSNAGVASRTVTLYDHQRQTRWNGTALEGNENTRRLGELGGNDYFADDLDDDSPIYNVVTVRVEVW